MKSPISNNNNNAINDVRILLIELRSNLSREEINRIRKKLFKEKEQEGSLTNRQKNVLKNMYR